MAEQEKHNPLFMLYAIGAPIRMEIKAENTLVELKLRPLSVRSVLAVWGKNNASLDPADVLNRILQDGIAEIRINGKKIEDLENLNPTIKAMLADIVLKANGIIEPSASLLAKALGEIEEDAYNSMRNDEYTPQSPFFPIAQMAYSALCGGAKFSASAWIDEPYVLLLAAMAVAKGEKRYFTEITKQAESIARTNLPTIPAEMAATGKVLKRRFGSQEEIKKEMIRLLESVAGIKLTTKG